MKDSLTQSQEKDYCLVFWIKLLKENVLNYFMSSDTAVWSFKLDVRNKQKNSVILNIFITKVYFAVQSSCLLFLYDCH